MIIHILGLLLLPFRIFLNLVNFLVLGSLHVLVLFFLGYEKGTDLKVAWLWAKITCFLNGAKLVVGGSEHLPKENEGAVFLFSHSSFLDIPVLLASYKGTFNFAAKSYVFKIPIVGQIGRLNRAIEIPKSRAAAIEQYKLAEERLLNGDKFMIAPEGSRGCGEELLPFKSGPFIFALNAKANLNPVLIYGAHRLWPKDDKAPNLRKFWSRVYVEFLPQISFKDLTEENRKEKAVEVRKSMSDVLETVRKM